MPIGNRALGAQLVEHQAVMHAGGREFESGGTNTQGLKITEEEVLPL